MRKSGELLNRLHLPWPLVRLWWLLTRKNGCGIPFGCAAAFLLFPAVRKTPLFRRLPRREQPALSGKGAVTMSDQEIIQRALAVGFAAAEIVDTRDIVFDPSFRPYCEENLCGQYGINYSCPPDCGSPEEMKNRVLAHKKALVLQTIWEISDYSDGTQIKPAKAGHNAAQIRLVKKLRAQGCDGLIVGASGCALCKPCALTKGLPCAFPEFQYSCMSAYCIFVKKLADACGMEYDCGEGLLAFFGMYAFD